MALTTSSVSIFHEPDEYTSGFRYAGYHAAP